LAVASAGPYASLHLAPDSTPPLNFLQAGCPSCHPTNNGGRQTDIYMNVNVNVKFKVTLHEQVRYRGSLQKKLITVLKVTVCHTAEHYGE